MTTTTDVQRLGASRFVSLTTYRRDGTAVATPVWVVADGQYLLVWAGQSSGKANRLRHTARITVAPSNGRGQLRGDPVPGTARLLPDAELARVERRIAGKYRIGWSALRLLARVRRVVRRGYQPSRQVGVEITLC